ncbi:peptide-N(4)-(N-acetyl-beta-glucosaminyl)asparagine amidase isoform X2 [Cryptomeria japonica]|uniref:peptide-N(4)-(N-acetyl-beta- glucosaminyl)asparagine amidase isoform X2 n=1 Tax=Cryptomeria japonica TaxID=3369 RepID=UPI0025AD44EB|nr:peptide-N(4)-(N-acetyl-beta-glucosaminyl)asparagine amidase isoform X2 [Cryptomeria japonica]
MKIPFDWMQHRNQFALMSSKKKPSLPWPRKRMHAKEKVCKGSLMKGGNFKPDKAEQDHALLLQLLFWFKQSFSWVNQPPCFRCGYETTSIGMGSATAEELRFGANRVELYRCKKCAVITRFPRYNDPLKLVETRRGRCGEWANCFTLYCRALGYQARLVLDFTDHVWTECFSNHLGRWMHLDPCESVYDNPLLYEEGWKKQLTYVIALSKDGVYDVTKRYTRKWHEILSRRFITSEANVQEVVSSLTREARRHLSPLDRTLLENRDKQELQEIEKSQYSHEELSGSLPGRQSGSKEWRIARAEFGADNDMSSKSLPCPIRTCIDDHVGRIYKSFGLILHKFIDNESMSRVVDEMKAVQMLISNLKETPFRIRKMMVDIKYNSLDLSKLVQSNSYQYLLQALSLKSCSDQNGKMYVCLAQEPVKTSLALPVACEILDGIVKNADLIKDLTHNETVKLFINCRRICSGSVQASGEQLPLGIATSAFDGLPSTKWEEPDGAKGSWIIYKLPNGLIQNLAAYEFTSANDAQERDPKDWVLEGSSDGHQTWDILDERKSQIFEKRFMRKTFLIAPEKKMFNTLRFRFLSVQNPNVTTRLQIACIDLYAKEDKPLTKDSLE